MSPKWKDNQPLTALTGRCLSEKVSLPLLHHRLFRMAELYPRPFHFVKKKFFGHHFLCRVFAIPEVSCKRRRRRQPPEANITLRPNLRLQPRPLFLIHGEAAIVTL